MKPVSFVVLVLSVLILASGCSLRNARIPSADIPFAEADYTVLGNTNAEACGNYVFGIDFVHLFSDRSATISGTPGVFPFLSTGLTREGSRALYDALEKIPEATHLVAPRITTSGVGFGIGPVFLFGRRCAIVDARGVVIGEEPAIKGEDLGRLADGE